MYFVVFHSLSHFVFAIYILDDALAQKAGLLTINILLNLNQFKKGEALVELLQKRMNMTSEFTSDEDDETDLTMNKLKEKTVKSLDHFKWMFRLYKIRSTILNGKNILIPTEDVINAST